MTLHSRCSPIGGFRCWQYRKTVLEVPTWACAYVTLQAIGKMDFQYPSNGGDFELKDGDWLVLFDFTNECVAIYDDEGFHKLFEVIE